LILLVIYWIFRAILPLIVPPNLMPLGKQIGK
jgi:hypothetical protein